MATLIGNKETFAIQIEITEYEPHLWGKTCLWLRGEKIGNFDDENILSGPFLHSLNRILTSYQNFWEPELANLDCKSMFLTINPFFDTPEAYYALNDEEAAKYRKYDKFSMSWGENYDEWFMSVVINEEKCKFLIFPFWLDVNTKNTDFSNGMRCFDLSFQEVYKSCMEVYDLIPEKHRSQKIEILRAKDEN